MGRYKVHSEHPSPRPRPYRDYEPDGYMTKRPVWAFSRCDKDHPRWAIRECTDLYETIISKLAAFEGMTWQEISSASGGKRQGHGSNSHFENVADLIKEAQQRLEQLHRYEDQLYSLRLSGTERLFGVLDEGGIFYILWFDSKHEICPTKNH